MCSFYNINIDIKRGIIMCSFYNINIDIKRGGFYNFVTKQFDDLDNIPDTDEAARQYIPQEALIQIIFNGYRALGKSTEEALMATLVDVHTLCQALLD